MTIAEKVYGLEVGGISPSPTVPTVGGLIEILKTDDAFPIWWCCVNERSDFQPCKLAKLLLGSDTS